MDQNPVNIRMDYDQQTLVADDLEEDPVAQLQKWLDTASSTDQLVEPSAMALATVDNEGRPAARTVLLRGIINGRLLFFTNYESRKARHLEANGEAALLFRWANPQRQVEVRGTVERATAAESDEYFASRPRGSQIAAHVSPQSSQIDDREWLDQRAQTITTRFEGVEVIPRPGNWGGYALTPQTFEFWQGQSSRLHDRFRYYRAPGERWTVHRLAP